MEDHAAVDHPAGHTPSGRDEHVVDPLAGRPSPGFHILAVGDSASPGVPSIYSVRLVNVDFRPACSMMTGMLTLILVGLLRGVRTQRSLVFENLALRHQLVVLQRTVPRPRLRTVDRLFWVLLPRLWAGWTDAISIVQPATVIRWQRTAFQLFWAWKSRRTGPGRPAVAPEVRTLIRHMSRANLCLLFTPAALSTLTFGRSGR